MPWRSAQWRSVGPAGARLVATSPKMSRTTALSETAVFRAESGSPVRACDVSIPAMVSPLLASVGRNDGTTLSGSRGSWPWVGGEASTGQRSREAWPQTIEGEEPSGSSCVTPGNAPTFSHAPHPPQNLAIARFRKPQHEQTGPTGESANAV